MQHYHPLIFNWLYFRLKCSIRWFRINLQLMSPHLVLPFIITKWTTQNQRPKFPLALCWLIGSKLPSFRASPLIFAPRTLCNFWRSGQSSCFAKSLTLALKLGESRLTSFDSGGGEYGWQAVQRDEVCGAAHQSCGAPPVRTTGLLEEEDGRRVSPTFVGQATWQICPVSCFWMSLRWYWSRVDARLSWSVANPQDF